MPGLHIRPLINRIICTTFAAAIIIALYLVVYRYLPAANAQGPVADTPRAAATVVPATVPDCTITSFGAPIRLNLSALAPGLHAEADAPAQYQIYGSTASDLRAQAQRCAPGANDNTSAEFTGQTAYSLVWQYDTAVSDNGCTLTDIRVGLHTAILLPDWQPTDSAAAGLAGRWQAFVTGLTVHENGHVAIDKTYAAKLANDLGNAGIIPCDAVAGDVHAITVTDVAALNRANDAYDATTNHGATQGAVFPAY